MMTRRITRICALLLLGVVGAFSRLDAQVESAVQVFNRGMLWQSLFNGKIGPNFSNWARRGIGLDWPGFDETLIREAVGGSPSHLVTGGFYMGCKKDADTVLSVEDWAMYATTVSSEPGAKYIITRHVKEYADGENWWLSADPLVGEEVIETVWQYNLNYPNEQDRRYQLPVRVRRTAHQWSGSRRDENYVLYEYVITNISNEIRIAEPTVAVPDTLVDFYAMATYAVHVNSRAWTILFPTLPAGARNTWLFYDASRRMIWGRAGDYLDSPGSEDYSYAVNEGPIVDGKATGEFLAPGFVGLRLLYSTPDQTGQATRVNKFGWSAGSSSIDLSGPFAGIGTLEDKYRVIRDPANAASFVSSPVDTVFMRRSRMWSLMSLGPWTIPPGDSVVIAFAEIVDGVDYSVAITPEVSASTIGSQGLPIFLRTADKARLTYAEKLAGRGLNHPDPPAAPAFTLDFDRERVGVAATVLEWQNTSEAMADPDDGSFDLAGYRVYRSGYLPIGPWQLVATIAKGDPSYYNSSTGTYRYVDESGEIGAGYYYSVTAYDGGKPSWAVDPAAVFPETGSNAVPSLESSIFANRTTYPFKMTVPALPDPPEGSAEQIIVAPNPFIVGEGRSQPAEGEEVLFVNIPNPCTIRIYTIRGDLVKTIEVPDGFGGIARWDLGSDFGQFVKSGVYVYHVDSPRLTKVGKFAVVK